MSTDPDLFPDPQDRIDFVDDRDLLELLNGILDDKDGYKDIVERIATLKILKVEELQIPLDFDLQDILHGANFDEGVVRLTATISQHDATEKVRDVAVASLDAVDITIEEISGSNYLIIEPYGVVSEMSPANFNSIFKEFRDSKSGLIDLSKVKSRSIQASIGYDYEIDLSDGRVVGKIIELETLDDTVFAFEIRIERPQPNGDMVGTQLSVIESLKKHSSIGVDQITPEHKVWVAISKMGNDTEQYEPISIEALNRVTSFPVEQISKTEIEDIIEAVFALRNAK